MRLLQKCDSSAFDAIYEKYKDEAVRTAYLITGNRSICEDIAQEAFVTCFDEIGSLKNPKVFKAWFFRILTRAAWRYGKKAKREIPSEDIADLSNEHSADLAAEQFTQSQANRMLYAEISRLEPVQKAVIVLYYFNGLSTREIASAMRCFEGTVKSRLYTARKKLKISLEEQESIQKECRTHAKPENA